MSIPPYTYWPIKGRPPLRWPEGKKMAFYIGLAIEHFLPGLPSTSISGSLGLTIDPMNHSWRDYGTRVGIWRMLELLDELKLPVSALVNSDVFKEYPQIVQAGIERKWDWIGHGISNSQLWAGFPEDVESKHLDTILDAFLKATGSTPKGWIGPALSETENTLRLLAHQGFTYTLDWAADDQPFPLTVPGARIISVPYTVEINDITAFILSRWTPEQFASAVIGQFDRLYAESKAGTGVVMAIGLHPFIVNVPYRHDHLKRALDHIRKHEDVWITTSDQIAAYYLENCYDEAVAAMARRKGA